MLFSASRVVLGEEEGRQAGGEGTVGRRQLHHHLRQKGKRKKMDANHRWDEAAVAGYTMPLSRPPGLEGTFTE